jgi:hypothetical protein
VRGRLVERHRLRPCHAAESQIPRFRQRHGVKVVSQQWRCSEMLMTLGRGRAGANTARPPSPWPREGDITVMDASFRAGRCCTPTAPTAVPRAGKAACGTTHGVQPRVCSWAERVATTSPRAWYAHRGETAPGYPSSEPLDACRNGGGRGSRVAGRGSRGHGGRRWSRDVGARRRQLAACSLHVRPGGRLADVAALLWCGGARVDATATAWSVPACWPQAA